MKKLLTVIMMFTLLLIPFAVYGGLEQQASNPPSVAPSLVREGDFAVKLVSALNIGAAKNEIEAESMLATEGISPRNGWISDYPVTPDILIEIQKAIGGAADAKRLSMGKDEAFKALRTTAVEFEIPIVAEVPSRYAESSGPTTPQYTGPSSIYNYYNTEGPPVVTYYPPPADYYYLYAWVPFPFWCSGFSFPGFFILHDFDRVIISNRNAVVITNHVFDRDHHRSFTVDPVSRWRGTGESLRAGAERPGGRRFTTAEARRGAESILQRSHEQIMPSRGLTGRNFATPRSQSTPALHARGGNGPRIATRENFRGIPEASGRSFSPPMRSEARSFSSPPMRSQGQFFSPPSMGSRGFSGVSSGGFHGGNLRPGGSFGGSRGGGFRGR